MVAPGRWPAAFSTSDRPLEGVVVAPWIQDTATSPEGGDHGHRSEPDMGIAGTGDTAAHEPPGDTAWDTDAAGDSGDDLYLGAS